MSDLGGALRALRARGFNPVAARLPDRAFIGKLPCAKGEIAVKLTISDWNFLSYPQIRLLEHSVFLPDLLPHIDVLSNLCYFAPGSVTLDRYDPATALLQCLNQATAVLDRIAANPSYRTEDIQNEFAAHWEYGQITPPWPILLGDIDPNATSAGYFIIENDGNRRILISSDNEEASRLASALGATVNKSRYRCWLCKSAILPTAPNMIPKTVKDLFEWLKSWDKTIYASVQQILAESEYLTQKFVTFAIKTPVGWIGFGFDLDQMKRKGYRRNPRLYRQYLHAKGGHQSLFRISIKEISSSYVHSRNLSFKDLHNKRVTVVGCGSIGSFVAHAMLRLGAGTGKLGALKLIDPDDLGPENLGRHVLGFPSLFKFKANALETDLKCHFPHSKVEAIASSAFEDAHLFGAELIIDATGEEAVSEFLNGLRLQRRSQVAMLHVWIRGNGEAVQALWTEKNHGGCYRCLLIPDDKSHRQERFRLLKGDAIRRTDGCRAYTPYAVSAPLQAAALATDMVCDWLQGTPSPRFRTRSTENANVFQVKNQDLSKIKGCPACDHP